MRSICVVLFVFCSVHVVFSKTQNKEDEVFSKIYAIRKNAEQNELTQKDVDWLYQTALKNMDASSCVPEAIVKTLVLAKKKKEPLKIAQLRLLSLCPTDKARILRNKHTFLFNYFTEDSRLLIL